MPRHATKTSFVKGDYRFKEYVKRRRTYNGSSNPNFKGGSIIGTCPICKNEFVILRSQIGRRICCSRKCLWSYMSTVFIKENSPNWKGGVTLIHQLIKSSKQYKEWRDAVFQRDNFVCKKCGANRVYLNAHHIKSFSHFPELRFEINNGITLCEPCHSLTENFKGRGKNQEVWKCQQSM